MNVISKNGKFQFVFNGTVWLVYLYGGEDPNGFTSWNFTGVKLNSLKECNNYAEGK